MTFEHRSFRVDGGRFGRQRCGLCAAIVVPAIVLLFLLCVAVGAAVARDTVLVSRASGLNGMSASGQSLSPSISRGGRYVTFVAQGPNLAPDDRDRMQDVFVRDLEAHTTTLVSRASGEAGAKGNGDSSSASISEGGRFVAFSSGAANLHPDDSDEIGDVFVRDLKTDTTTLVSRASGRAGAKGDGPSFLSSASDLSAVSAGGRFVAFESAASNLHPGDPEAGVDVFVRDTRAGTTTLVSRASGAAGAKGNRQSCCASISADGRFVAFASGADNLHPDDNDRASSVFVRDLEADTTTLVSRGSGPNGANGNGAAYSPSISDAGRVVSFVSGARNLAPADRGRTDDVFVRDLEAQNTTLVSRASGKAVPDGSALLASVSGDGRLVAFLSEASNLHPYDPDPLMDVFVRDLEANTTTLASRASGRNGAKANGGPAAWGVALAGDGSSVAFSSGATNLSSADPKPIDSVFVRGLGPKDLGRWPGHRSRSAQGNRRR